MSISSPCLRYFVRACGSPLRLQQRRWARVHDIRFVATRTNAQNRYQEKLEQKAREEGFESVSQLKEAYKERIESLRKKVSTELAKATTLPTEPQSQTNTTTTTTNIGGLQTPPPSPTAKHTSQPPPPTSKPKETSSSSGTPGIKPLSSYLDLPKIRALPTKEIEYIWRLRHASDPLSLTAVIPLQTYHRIYETARTHPRFILPLPRPAASDGSGDIETSPSGYDASIPRTASDIHFLQWSFHPPAGPPAPPGQSTQNTHTSTILFTHLAAFKLHGEFAQPHTTVTHHLDLADSHGIVLLHGAVTEGKGVSVEEGKWLLLCMQKFYDYGGHGGGVGMEKRQGLLQKFNKGDETFSLDELVDEAERIS